MRRIFYSELCLCTRSNPAQAVSPFLSLTIFIHRQLKLSQGKSVAFLLKKTEGFVRRG